MDVLIVATLLFLATAVIIYYINRRLGSSETVEIMKLLQHNSQEDRRVLLESLQRNTNSLNERLDTAARVIGDVQKSVGEVGEIGRSMRDLQEFLRSPKLRGNIGEQILKELLGQMLPKSSFHLQYTFRSGEKVDAAIQTAGGIVPIDSKFPMENFRAMNKADNDKDMTLAKNQFVSDVKKHIQSISKKYILPDEGTIDYALMYIPSEAVYYEIVNNPKLFEYSGECRVLPVSPTTFYAYMKAILMSFEGQKIESQAKEILTILRSIQKDYSKVESNLGVLQKHLGNASNMMGSVLTEFSSLGQKISSTKRLGEKIEGE